jgi:hypothetical protein
MIAPDENVGKRQRKYRDGTDAITAMIDEHHEFVNGIILLPNCGQARVKLECE